MKNLISAISDRLSGKKDLPIGILGPYDNSAFKAILKAREAGWITPVILGKWPIKPEENIEQLATDTGIGGIREQAWKMLKAGTLLALLHTGLLDQGLLSFIGALLPKDNNAAASHVTLFRSLKGGRFILFTDTLFNRTPGLREKSCIVLNAAQLARKLRIREPKVAALAPIEIVNPSIPSTIDAAALAKMSERGQLGNVILEGPLAMDNAESSDAAIHKGILSPVPGDVDIYLFPDLESALLSAQFVSLAGAIPTAECILGTMWPVVINSGTGSVESWLCNIALGVLLAEDTT